jgi:hypothetical protein
MDPDRHLSWEGCHNARDLGGIRTREGMLVRRGAIVRSDALDELTEDGWQAVEAHGIRTIIDLRNDDERNVDGARPRTVDTISIPIDNMEDAEFWAPWRSGWQFGTPLYVLSRSMPEPDAGTEADKGTALGLDRAAVPHRGRLLKLTRTA